ncbi:MAG: creatininase family protein [Dinoroseobacter sp.]|nr:creatininase family protein [Dinoroseobacter sp.]
MAKRRLDWAEFKTTEFEALDPEKVIAVLPTAAIEQHGPHLPTGTDMMIMEGMLAQLRTDLPEDLDIRILPIQSVGKSNEHLHAAGTLTLPAEIALQAWREIGLSIARTGLRKVVLVNSHGGNLDLVSILSRELRVRAGMLAVKTQWMSFGTPEGLYSDRERAFGIHGGDIETSLMLQFRPDLVDMSEARDFLSSAENGTVPPIGPISYGWISSDLNDAGAVGNAARASAEKGQATCVHQVAGMIALLRAVRDRPLTGLMPTDPA